MRLLCVGRHRFLSEHFCTFFSACGAETRPAVGLDGALAEARSFAPEAVVCDYDLLATVSLERWEQDPLLGRVPVIAVSLARRPGEEDLLDLNGIAGFLYLPTLEREDVLRVLAAVRGSASDEAREPRGAPHDEARLRNGPDRAKSLPFSLGEARDATGTLECR